MPLDPRRLRPGELVRLLNSTPLGEVVSESRFRRLRLRAGLQIGDGRHVDLLRLCGWLLEQRLAAGEAYARHREAARLRQRRLAEEGCDIGPLPAVANPVRREACRLSLRTHLETYHPDVFFNPWSTSQLDLIARAERIILQGGRCAVAYERGGGKSCICEGAIEWALLHGHRRYVFVLTSTEEKFAAEYLESLKTTIESNLLLMADFPEVCVPIVQLQATPQRARRQTIQGKPTWIGWKGSKRLILPTVEGSAASGAILSGSGLTARGIRGSRFRTRDGRMLRPDLVVIDDVQDDESAASPEQCDKYERLINGTVLGMAGPGVDLAILFPCTIIQPGDLADRLTNRERNPHWHGLRSALLRSWPENLELWEQWWEVCRDELRSDSDLLRSDCDPTPRGTEFLRAHYEEMHRGAEVSNPHRRLPWQLSAVHFAMWTYFTIGSLAFFSEYQNWITDCPNSPTPPNQHPELRLDPEQLAGKCSGYSRGTIPSDVQWVTAFIDVGERVHWWLVLGTEADFTCYVVDYGTWPETRKAIFSKENFRPTLREKYPGQSAEGAIVSGLEELTADILARDWKRQDGASLQCALCLVDANFANKPIRRWINRSPLRARLRTSIGRKCSANETPLSEYKVRAGELHGDDWLIRASVRGETVRHVLFDTYRWKTFAARRLATPLGEPGCCSLPSGTGGRILTHTLLSRHLTSEYAQPLSGQYQVEEWRLRPGQTNNDWWDCLVGAMVAASICGARLDAPRGSARPGARARGGSRTHREADPERPYLLTTPDGRPFFLTARD